MKKCAMSLALAAAAGCGSDATAQGSNEEHKAVVPQTTTTQVTDENGVVSKTVVETSVKTNGNMVTELRRETKTSTDKNGNIIAREVSEYSESYPASMTKQEPAQDKDKKEVADKGAKDTPAADSKKENVSEPARDDASFLGFKFGAEIDAKDAVSDENEPLLLRVQVKPDRPLPGFDDYYAYLTPRTHKLVKICACAKNAVDPGDGWRRHYLIEALEKRYGTWAKLCSFTRPFYVLDIAPDRYVTICLSGAGDWYETVISAWDAKVAREAAEEHRALRAEAAKNAAEKRNEKIKAASELF